MAKKPQYPLEDVLKVKRKRVEDAEKALRLRREELVVEQEKLKVVEQARDVVKNHLADKLKQFRSEMDHGTNTHKITQMKDYMKVVQEKLVIEEKKVKEQKDRVKLAEKKVEEAKIDLTNKQKEVDKLKEHRENWLAGAHKEMEVEEARDQDELGNIIFSLQRRKE